MTPYVSLFAGRSGYTSLVPEHGTPFHKAPFAAEHTRPPDTLPDISHFAGTSTDGLFASSDVTEMVPVDEALGTTGTGPPPLTT